MVLLSHTPKSARDRPSFALCYRQFGPSQDLAAKLAPHFTVITYDRRGRGESGFLVASAANGFAHTDPVTCAQSPYSFHPEYATAKFGNFVSWAAEQANVDLSIETGHFNVCDKVDPATASCAGNEGLPVHQSSGDAPSGSSNYEHDYPIVQIETDILAAEASCNIQNGVGCVLPPPGANFYPYFSVTCEHLVK